MIQESTMPLLIFGTRHGTVYNLSPTNLPALLPALQLCYGDFHDHKETLSKLPEGMNLKKFLHYPQDSLIYLTPYDHSKKDCMTGCQNNSKVKIKCNKGYTEIDATAYNEMIELLKPDIVVGLTEYPSLEKDHSSESNKSHKRAICKTKSYLEKSPLTQSQESDKHEGKPLRLAAVHGGKNLSLINRSLEQVLDHSIDGIVLCDLCENQTLEEREEIYTTVFKRLEQEYAREKSYFHTKKLKLCLAGIGKIEDIQHGMKFGIQMFEVNYPFLIAEQQKALVTENDRIIERSPEKKENLNPLEENCECSTCKNHAESYIAHLIECYELTAKILLSIHNLHKYQRWMQSLKVKA